MARQIATQSSLLRGLKSFVPDLVRVPFAANCIVAAYIFFASAQRKVQGGRSSSLEGNTETPRAPPGGARMPSSSRM